MRLDYREPFQYPLSVYLNGINWALWSGNEDTSNLIEELKRAIAGGTLSISTEHSKADLLQISSQGSLPRPSPSAQPVPLEMPEGTMDSESGFYIERPQDATAIAFINRGDKNSFFCLLTFYFCLVR